MDPDRLGNMERNVSEAGERRALVTWAAEHPKGSLLLPQAESRAKGALGRTES